MEGQKKRTPFWVSFAAGGIAGTVGAVLTCPLEVVKTRLQSSKFQVNPAISISNSGQATMSISSHNPFVIIRPVKAMIGHVNGTVQVLKSMAIEEGVGALWKGVGATIVGVVPARAIYFSTYHRGKHWLSEAMHLPETDARVHLGAAALAGMATCTATNPIWLIKTRMQLQSSARGKVIKYQSSIDCLRKVIREEGVAGLYKGLSASYIGVAESALQWAIYEHLKKSINNSTTTPRSSDSDPRWLEYFGAAAGAKLIAAVLAYPHEVLRTRMRECLSNDLSKKKYTTIRHTVQCIVREEGIAALYGGMTAHLMRVVPNSAIMFFCYEFLVHSYEKLVST